MATRRRPAWPFDPRVRQLLLQFLKASNTTGRPYAIGGALAMSAHGYVRQTQDVDAFLAPGDAPAWIRALRAQGLTVDTVFPDFHYAARIKRHNDPEVRIDLLVPYDDPDWSAVQFPDVGAIGGIDAELFPLVLLVASKFQSDRPSDRADVDAMYARGLFDPAEVARVLRNMDKDLAREFTKRYR